MDAQESIFQNAGVASFTKDKTDILNQKYNLREKK